MPLTLNDNQLSMTLRIGCAGWSVARGSALAFATDGSHLQRYSRVLNACEINSSFYRPHKAETWQRWAQTVPEDFQFSVKTPKAITHEARLSCTPEVLESFLRQVGHLGPKLGPILIQLPPSLAFERRIAEGFLSLLRERFAGAVVWEPRHATWFSLDAASLLKDFNVARCAADPACVPEASVPGGAETMAYFRLHGSPRVYWSYYSDEFLRRLAERMQDLARRIPVWCIFDNTADGGALQNALALKSILAPRLATDSNCDPS